MNKLKILPFAFGLLLSVGVLGQQAIRHDVLASAGGFGKSGDISLSWTLGELVVHTLTSQDGSLILTQGFQQSKLTVTGIEDALGEMVEVKIYPNPTEAMIQVLFASPLEEEVTIQLFDADGRMLLMEKLPVLTELKQLNLQDYMPGEFYLKVVTSKAFNTYKIIKH